MNILNEYRDKMKVKIKEHRQIFRDWLTAEYKKMGSLIKGEYKKRIKYAEKNLSKYVNGLHQFAKIYQANNNLKGKQKRIIDKICMNKFKINDVLEAFKLLDLKDGFINYFLCKTNMSFWYDKPNPKFGKNQKRSKKQLLKSLNEKGGNDTDKFAEFIYIILCEYIVLHNYMWCSGMEPQNMISIDDWIK